jgi:endonuclease-3 related protein
MEVFRILLATYGPQHWWPADTPWEVMVGAVLTQATNWRNVELAIQRLKEARILHHPCQIASMDIEALQTVLRPTGYYRVKAHRLVALARFLCDNYPDLQQFLLLEAQEQRRMLLSLPGIGPETADSIILYAAGKPVFVVDAYTVRFLTRLGMVDGRTSFRQIQHFLTSCLPADVALFNEFHALIVQHSKVRCRKVPLCDHCPFAEQRLCRYIMGR